MSQSCLCLGTCSSGAPKGKTEGKTGGLEGDLSLDLNQPYLPSASPQDSASAPFKPCTSQVRVDP